jgi:hypothetical protein
VRGAHEDDASLCAARLHSIRAAQRPAQSLRTYALWATTCGTTPQAARRAPWHYRALIETYSAGHKSSGFEELDQVASEIEDLAASEVLNALALQTPF